MKEHLISDDKIMLKIEDCPCGMPEIGIIDYRHSFSHQVERTLVEIRQIRRSFHTIEIPIGYVCQCAYCNFAGPLADTPEKSVELWNDMIRGLQKEHLISEGDIVGIPLMGKAKVLKPSSASQHIPVSMPKSEAAILKEVRLAVSKCGGRVWRNDNGMGFRADGSQFPYGLGSGTPDLVGIIIGTGQALWIEVKREGGNPTEKQQHILDMINQWGGKAFIARSAEDVYREMKP